MRVKGNKRSKIALLFGFAGATLLATGFFASSAMAQVNGKCDNCHTMHNSQNGNSTGQVHIGTNAGWDTSTKQLTNGNIFGEQEQLLKSNCVGCHSATSADTTIIDDGNNKVPIVFNMGATYPAGALAGGNFNKNTGSADIYGHNVGGISAADATIAVLEPPGSQNGCGTQSCHTTLALSEADILTGENFNYGGISQGKFNGCKGCHNKVSHHNPNDTSYRFLGGHNEPDLMGVPGLDKVLGTEDPNWEVAPTNLLHNVYKSQTNKDVKDSMGAFCAGCHQDFHALGKGIDPWTGTDNGGDPNTDNLISANSGTTPWLRHPTNVNIPFDVNGEYFALQNADYNPAIPLAQDLAANTHTIESGDQVMCLSCHRAHASEYPDALRFNYSSMKAHNGTGAGTGCFFCHTTKDD